jgi:hypothetical protein
VCIVAAGVHDVDFAAVGKPLPGGGRIGEAGCFAHRVRVHVGAEPDDRPRAIRQHADDAGLAYSLGHHKAKRLQVTGDDCRSAFLGEGNFRVLVKVLEDRGQARSVSIHQLIDPGDKRIRNCRRHG